MHMKFTAKESFVNGLFAKGNSDSQFDFIIPGFVDIHCHGGGGKYFSEDFNVARNAHRDHGTVVQIASLVTAPINDLIDQINVLKSARGIYGIHLEGPYLSTKYCGAHDPGLLKTPTISEVKQLINAGEGAIKMITIAPELPGAIEVIEYLTSNNVVVAIGHSDADAAATKEAITAGATVVTHLNNGMAKIGTSNTLSEFALQSDLFLELIQDGIHVSSEHTLQAIHSSKKIVAVTDAMSAAGCSDGEYKIGQLPVTVNNGVAILTGTKTLAGSTLTMLQSFTNFVKLVGFESAVNFAIINPCKVLGIELPKEYIGIKDEKVVYL